MRAYSDVEYVFEPHDKSLPSARQYIQDVWDRRAFIVAKSRADLKSPHSGTVLGDAWRVIDPLFQALIYWFLFTAIRGKSSASFFLIVVSGVFLFNFTMTALSQGGRAIQNSKGLVLNSTFPLATLPISTIYRGVLEFIPTIFVYAVFHVVFGGPIGAGLFMLPFLFILQIAISTGVALIFATLTVYVADMSNLLNYILRVLLFITPVIYPVAQLAKAPAALRVVLVLNPFFALFSAYQYVFTGLIPTTGQLMQVLFWAAVLPVVGYRFFVSRERGFAMRL